MFCSFITFDFILWVETSVSGFDRACQSQGAVFLGPDFASHTQLKAAIKVAFYDSQEEKFQRKFGSRFESCQLVIDRNNEDFTDMFYNFALTVASTLYLCCHLPIIRTTIQASSARKSFTPVCFLLRMSFTQRKVVRKNSWLLWDPLRLEKLSREIYALRVVFLFR